ncbi:hypothetical protein MAP00_005617 [Monascus purpureus]|nr:hypothetical protein MAP00_000670 [Monascus purpureus]BDD60494.1 hypothetical protein MAP00_005617 [Monascus purpureus]
MSGEPTTPPATAIRRSRRRNLQNRSSNIDETSSSVVSEEIETPTPSGANLSSTNTANMASTNELTPDLADMMRQMLARQNQMEQDMRDREARMELKLASIIQSNTPQASLPSNTTQDTTPMDIQPPLRDASDTNISNAIALVQADVDTLLPD